MAGLILGAIGTVIAIAINRWLCDRYETVGPIIGAYVCFGLGATAFFIAVSLS